MLSFGLSEYSTSAWVDGDFLVLRRLPSVDRGIGFESTFSLPLGRSPCKLQPGPQNAIKMRLDDGPMRPHLLNECVYIYPYPFYRLTRRSTGHCHLLTAMGHCMPNLMSGFLKFGHPRLYRLPLPALIILTAQV